VCNKIPARIGFASQSPHRAIEGACRMVGWILSVGVDHRTQPRQIETVPTAGKLSSAIRSGNLAPQSRTAKLKACCSSVRAVDMRHFETDT
jgi:hypothetical protein